MWPNYEVVFSKPQSVTVQTLDSVAYCFLSSLSHTDIIVLAVATTQVYLHTLDSPVSAPASPSVTRCHLPTWASLVSVPA